jgi:prevent-host-death family protein
MRTSWPLQDAKNRLSEVVERARTEGPQRITRHGRGAAVLMSVEDFEALTGCGGSLVDFLRKSPLCGADLDLSRGHDMGRQIDL